MFYFSNFWLKNLFSNGWLKKFLMSIHQNFYTLSCSMLMYSLPENTGRKENG